MARLRDLWGPAEVFGNDEYADVVASTPDLPKYVIDAGAHVGSFSIWVAMQSDCLIYAIEPNLETFQILEHNVELLGLNNRVKVDSAALASTSGRRAFYITDHSESASLVSNQDARRDTWVRTFTLTDLIEASGFPRVDLMKVDIEGAEYEVFAAANDASLRAVRTVIVECHPSQGNDPEQVAVRLHRAGFTVRSEAKTTGYVTLIGQRSRAD